MKIINKYALLFLALLPLLESCKKEPDTPPVKKLSDGDIVTIDTLRAWQAQYGSLVFEDSISVFGIVSMDENNGNIYKNIYLQDGDAAINVRLTRSSNLQQGDSVRIALNGAILSEFSGVVQLDNVDTDKNIIVQKSDVALAPLVLTIPEIDLSIHESRLIQLNDVQFKASEFNKTFADVVNQYAQNRYFEDFDGNSLYIRTSGFADFAGDTLPTGSGSMVCIVSEYNGDLQLILRSPEESKLEGPRGPGEFLVKDFNDDDLTSGGWTVQQVIGSHEWEIGTLGSWEDKPYGVISNYDGGNTACESWFVSPSMDLSLSESASLSFDNAYNYSGDPLKILVSTDYPGTGNPNDYSWTELSATWSSGDFEFVNSGLIDLSAYLSNNVHIAFKYVGTDSSGRTWEIDNIIING
ncbi:DUF5689 domain-containing protein [Crocinitomix algicola]|uniref:DUF5689 domain-containing protein n=1 Tax=Crocinitomix algicola TaxID=1740263 RepID=UPI0008724DE6|nr:DUF5689 domain-containing protein [Crocinitomix algicola]